MCVERRAEEARGASSCSLVSVLRMQGVLGKCQALGRVVRVLGECCGPDSACIVPAPPRTGGHTCPQA